jgi:glycogen(starch) synthase
VSRASELPRPRRVLMTADAVGGVWDYALELGRGLGEAAGVEVVLAVMGPPPDEGQTAAARALGNVELCLGPYRLEWMEEPWDDLAAAGAWLTDLAARRAVDLVHLNGFVHAALPFAAPKLVVGHSCVLSWWRAVRHAPAPAAWDRYRRAVGEGLLAADALATPTAAMLAALEAEHGCVRGAVVIPNGRSAGDFRPGSKQCFVLSAGRLWDEAKNAAMLARVADRLPWPVRIAGAVRPSFGGGSSSPPAFACEAATNVQCLGRLSPSALAAQYAAASVYALPARYEPFGLTVLEAALAGAALVLGDIPSLRELWQEAAVFVPPDDEAALTAALTAIIADPGLRASLAKRARTRAARFSAHEMVRGYLAAYAALLAPRHRPIDGEEVPRVCAS